MSAPKNFAPLSTPSLRHSSPSSSVASAALPTIQIDRMNALTRTHNVSISLGMNVHQSNLVFEPREERNPETVKAI